MKRKLVIKIFPPLNNERGLSLIEILVALALAALIFVSVDFAANSDRDKLDSALDTIESAIQFSMSEAVLRGSMVRLHFLLDEDPQQMSVQGGPDGDFVLPSLENYKDSIKLTLADGAKRDELMKSVNKEFNTIKEFQDENFEFPSRVKLLAIVTSLRGQATLDGEGDLYIFPSGEKDAALIILGTDDEIVTLKIDPFTDDMERTYITTKTKESLKVSAASKPLAEADLLGERDLMIKSLIEEWKKK